MTWNYRIVRHVGANEWFGLHEVFYDEAGTPTAMSEPVDFVSDSDEGPAGIVRALEMALADAKRLPVLDDTDIPKGTASQTSS